MDVSEEDIRSWLADPQPHPAIAEVIPEDRPFTLSPSLARFLGRCVLEAGAKRVVEFGAGASSRVLARALGHGGGGSLTSVEETPDWCRDYWAQAEVETGVDSELVVAPLALRMTRQGPVFAYRGVDAALRRRGPFDLAVIDAPQGCYGRDGSLRSVLPHLNPGALVVLDDAGRWKERLTLKRCLAAFPALRPLAVVPGFAGRGVAVLRLEGEPRERLNPVGCISQCGVAVINWRWRRRHRDLVSPKPPAGALRAAA